MTGSPCIGVCRMDETGSFCQGCWRTLEEIGAWPAAADVERMEILAFADQRRAAAGEPR